jgi:tetratricopeptide (TPR) repeat protein
MPKHWKFTEKLMPERDSKWILFIESAVPKLGMFDLYQGSYGRQPATEENLNQLNSLLDRYNMRNMRAFNAQQPDTVTLVVHANKAAKAYNDQQWAEAKNEFRICIGERPQSVEFYEGLFNTCMKSGEWDQVAYALEKIFAIDPSQKIAHSYEYGQALFNLNRYDEAIPNLKTALKTANNPTFEYTPKKKRQTEIQPSTGTICIFDVVRETGPLLSYLHASTHSESICLAEYKGYDESNDIGWNLPPKAHYHITEVLKGPPYPMLLPVKFEFHDLIDPTMPKGWKFSEKLMPEKDSKWILFIEFAVPRRATSGQWFELYQGSYGRQPATEENLKQLNSLLDKYNMRNTRP